MCADHMKCESCNERDATVHFTEIMGNQKKEVHLCEECARQKELPIQASVSLADILTGLLQKSQAGELKEMKKLLCKSCGASYAEFQSSGRLGCPDDYEVFKKPLSRLLERIQEGGKHVGKVPASAGETLVRHNELLRLRRELDRAVLREDYEKAKELRDHIAEFTRTGQDDGNQG